MTGDCKKDGVAGSGSEFPTQHQLQVYGDFLFLTCRSAHHRLMSVANLHAAIEPPIALGQYRVFRFDDIPRALFTWARLGPEAERRHVGGAQLRPEDWRSGDHLWLIDLIAPYPGLVAGISRWIMTTGNLTEKDFYFRRVVEGNKTRRILHVDVSQSKKSARVLCNADFGVSGNEL